VIYIIFDGPLVSLVLIYVHLHHKSASVIDPHSLLMIWIDIERPYEATNLNLNSTNLDLEQVLQIGSSDVDRSC